MSAQAFHAIATQFRDRYLHPLQFRRGNTIEDRVGALENSRAGQGTPEVAAHGRLGQENTPAAVQPHLHTDEHFDQVMARSADLLERTKRPQSTTWGEQMGQRLGEKHDRVEAADHARVMKRSGDILQNIRNTAAEHRAAAPLPEERHADNMSRSGELLNRIRESQARNGPATPTPSASTPKPSSPGLYNQDEDRGWVSQVGHFDASAPGGVRKPAAPKPQRVVQAGLFGPSQVRAPQQFGLAATQGPRPQGKPTMTAPRGPRVTQPGLFPKSAVKKSRGFPPHREIG
jgi:hypothetical protein